MTAVRTRYGRLIKKPELYVPQVDYFIDDEDGDYDVHELEGSVTESSSSDDSSLVDEEDADEHGNLDGFITYSEDGDDDKSE